ncbi:hypothetical protein RJT34_32457 [Clitoria ternatea]|uniref:Uncharacterized protein n=1 Tax=Clitoria ternatea TaxID=43366 RepID=A0AAN9EY61_CLITE
MTLANLDSHLITDLAINGADKIDLYLNRGGRGTRIHDPTLFSLISTLTATSLSHSIFLLSPFFHAFYF